MAQNDFDADICQRILNNDADAEAALFQRFHRPLSLMLMQRAKNREVAEDLMQDNFIILLGRLRARELEDPHRLAAFAHKVAHNVWIGYTRKQSRRQTDPDSEAIAAFEDAQASQYELIVQEHAAEMVRDLLSTLPIDRDREILKRAYLQDQTKSQICEALNLSTVHYDRVMHRAKKRFRDHLQSKLTEIEA